MKIDKDKEYYLIVTPKGFTNIINIENELKEIKIEIKTTNYIYMNMIEGWTEDECDNVAYLLEKQPPINNNFFINSVKQK